MAKKASKEIKHKPLQPHPKENVAHKVNRWHHTLSQITGGLARATGQQALSRTDLTDWATAARQVSDEMFALRKAKAKGA